MPGCNGLKVPLKSHERAASLFKFKWQNLMTDFFLGPEFISMPPDFSGTWVVMILVLLVHIVIIKLQRAMHELKDFTAIIEELILTLRESK